MTGTSRALRRLGVAGLGAVLMSAGLVPFTEIAAHAAVVYPATTATSVSLSPDSDTAANGECNPFTATVAPTGTSFTVNIQQAIPAATTPTSTTIGFCNPSATSTEGNSTATLPGPQANAAGTTATGTSGGTCTNNNNTTTTAGNVSCVATFTDTDKDGKVVFGVTSNQPGTMTVDAFGDTNANGALDVGENGDRSTKTWVANAPNAGTNKITCTPASATNPAGTQHTFTCTETDANGNPLANNSNIQFVITSGPDSSPVPHTSCTTTATGAGGTTPGQSTCTYTNNGTPGHDVITVYLEQNGVAGQQTGEPSTTITKDWVLPAPNTSQVVVTCSTGQTGSSANGASGTDATCVEPLSATSVTVTAKVTNGNPAQNVAGVVVQFSLAANGGTQDANDTESISPASCTTAADGTCSTTFTDTKPSDTESWKVQASVPRQGAGPAVATATITYHQAGPAEARTITLAPHTSTQAPGGAQDFTATVKDRTGNPVPGVCVGFNESGPGHFASGTGAGQFGCQFFTANTYGLVCTTSAAGTCSVTVVSQSTESGTETVTATIDPNNYPGGANGTNVECSAPAGQTFVGPSSSTNPGTASGAPAGNCSDSGTVTWKRPTPPPPTGRQNVSVKNACFSHRAHRVTCIAQLSKAIAGVTVVFWDNHGNKVGSDITGAAGKAYLHLRGLRSGSKHKYQAHAKRSSRTFSAWSKFASVLVK